MQKRKKRKTKKRKTFSRKNSDDAKVKSVFTKKKVFDKLRSLALQKRIKIDNGIQDLLSNAKSKFLTKKMLNNVLLQRKL